MLSLLRRSSLLASSLPSSREARLWATRLGLLGLVACATCSDVEANDHRQRALRYFKQRRIETNNEVIALGKPAPGTMYDLRARPEQVIAATEEPTNPLADVLSASAVKVAIGCEFADSAIRYGDPTSISADTPGPNRSARRLTVPAAVLGPLPPVDPDAIDGAPNAPPVQE